MPRKILALFANTDGENLIDGSRENRVIEECVRLPKNRLFELVAKHAASDGDLERGLHDDQPAIVHISAHGSRKGLIFVDEDRKAREVPLGELAKILAEHELPVWIAVLNACYTTVSDEDLARFPARYVITMSGEIDDDSAIEFTRGFYTALAADKDVQTAFRRGKSRIQDAEDLPRPHLHVNENVPVPPVAPDAAPPVIRPRVSPRQLIVAAALVLALIASVPLARDYVFVGPPTIAFNDVDANATKLMFTASNRWRRPVVLRNFSVDDTRVQSHLRFGAVIFGQVNLERGISSPIELVIERLIRYDKSPLPASATVSIRADAFEIDEKTGKVLDDGPPAFQLVCDVPVTMLQRYIDINAGDPGSTAKLEAM